MKNQNRDGIGGVGCVCLCVFVGVCMLTRVLACSSVKIRDCVFCFLLLLLFLVPTVQYRSDIIAAIPPNQMWWWPSEQWHSSSHQWSKLDQIFPWQLQAAMGEMRIVIFRHKNKQWFPHWYCQGQIELLGSRTKHIHAHSSTQLNLSVLVGHSTCVMALQLVIWWVEGELGGTCYLPSCHFLHRGRRHILLACPGMLIKLLCNHQKRRLL